MIRNGTTFRELVVGTPARAVLWSGVVSFVLSIGRTFIPRFAGNLLDLVVAAILASMAVLPSDGPVALSAVAVFGTEALAVSAVVAGLAYWFERFGAKGEVPLPLPFAVAALVQALGLVRITIA